MCWGPALSTVEVGHDCEFVHVFLPLSPGIFRDPRPLVPPALQQTRDGPRSSHRAACSGSGRRARQRVVSATHRGLERRTALGRRRGRLLRCTHGCDSREEGTPQGHALRGHARPALQGHRRANEDRPQEDR